MSDHNPNVFFSLRPSLADATKIAPSGTTPAEDIHITLAFLGRRSALPDGAMIRLAALLNHFSASHGAVTALTGSLHRFPGLTAGADVTHYVYVTGPTIIALRAALVATIAEIGIEYDKTFNFSPHITVGRGPENVRWAYPMPRPMRLRFDRLWLCVGREMVSAPFVRAVAGREK